MKKRGYTGILFVLLFFYGTIYSIAQKQTPWSTQYRLPDLAACINFPEPVEKIRQIVEEEQNGNSALKTWIYAAGIETSLEPQNSGQWDTLPAKGYVWRLGIQAENALSLNLLIENYRMKPGMALYAYNRARDHTAGPFDARNNANGGILPVMSLPGDMIIVEWNIPFDAQFSMRHGEERSHQFSIVSVGYGFRDMAGGRKTPLLAADKCNIDINCKTGNHWQREQRSVVRLQTIFKNGNSQFCTGTLINQAVDANRKKPYILTANHCISTLEYAQSTTFVFGYEKEYCNGNAISLPVGIAGSNLLSTKRELDFTLLEMSENATNEKRPFYAGWTAANDVPRSVTGIHHPQGDVKKISVARKPLITGTFTDPNTNLICDDHAHWIVSRWDEGVTEQGSSGSPVFDENNRIVGLLSGGAATCSNPIDDYYGKFNQQWDKYPLATESLKSWLDPDHKNITSLWGYDPVTSFEGQCDTLRNIGKNETKTLVVMDEWGYLTGQNNRDWRSFAEKISNDTVVKIIGLEALVAKVSDEGAKVRFSVWSGADFPVVELYAKEMMVTADYTNYPLHVYFDKSLTVTGNFFIGYSLEYDAPVNTFAVYHSEMRPYNGIPSMFVKENNGAWTSLDQNTPPFYTSLGIGAIGRFAKPAQAIQPKSDKLLITYRQGSNNILVYFENPEAVITLDCFDTSGKQVPINEINRHTVMIDEDICLQLELNNDHLPPGVYLLQAFDNHTKRTGKFIKTH